MAKRLRAMHPGTCRHCHPGLASKMQQALREFIGLVVYILGLLDSHIKSGGQSESKISQQSSDWIW